MDITFTKGEDSRYTATALRNDGVLLQVNGGDRKFALPHDIAHFIVEHGLGLKQGFWGRVARGGVFPGMKELQGRKPVHAAERSRAILREDEQQGIEAEVLVGVLCKIMREGLEADWPAARKLLNQEWRPNRPERGLPGEEEVLQICAALREAQNLWQSLEVGQAVTYVWTLDRSAVRRRSVGKMAV
jgi:hypothetical protein